MFFRTTIDSEQDEKFIKFTAKSINKLDQLICEDKTNKTPAARTVDEYEACLNFKSLPAAIIQLAKTENRKIRILDAGCGRGTAIDELLSNPKLKDVLESCTGISMNYFSNIKKIMESHGNRFVYYYGTVQAILATMHNEFDIILDEFGPYLYSINKVEVLKFYHQALKPKGEARIADSEVDDTVILFPKKRKPFIPYIISQYPDTFSKHKTDDDDYYCLTLKKSSERFPLSRYAVISYSEIISVDDGLTKEQARNGNALAPDQVCLKPVEDQMMLRSLSYK